MLSIGCVRAKFAKHISMLILVDACASGFGFYLFGCIALQLSSLLALYRLPPVENMQFAILEQCK